LRCFCVVRREMMGSDVRLCTGTLVRLSPESVSPGWNVDSALGSGVFRSRSLARQFDVEIRYLWRPDVCIAKLSHSRGSLHCGNRKADFLVARGGVVDRCISADHFRSFLNHSAAVASRYTADL
jgi:hypothetical protein